MAGTGVRARFCPSLSARSNRRTGPTLLTVGPWRPVSLQTYHTRISDLHISAQVDVSLEVDLVVCITLSPSGTLGTAEILLRDPENFLVSSQSNVKINGGAVRAVFHYKKGEVRLWYPVGYGEQPLYEVQVKVFDDVRSF